MILNFLTFNSQLLIIKLQHILARAEQVHIVLIERHEERAALADGAITEHTVRAKHADAVCLMIVADRQAGDAHTTFLTADLDIKGVLVFVEPDGVDVGGIVAGLQVDVVDVF